MSLTKAAKNALLDRTDSDNNPFQISDGRPVMRFDSITLVLGPPAEIVYSYRGVQLYVSPIGVPGPGDSVTIHGFDGSMGISLEA